MDTDINQAIDLIDSANRQDPNQEQWNGELWPKELLYSKRMSQCLNEFVPECSPLLKIAARGHHIRRWELPRTAYPMNKAGYYKWRNQQKKTHAEHIGQIMAECGFNKNDIDQVKLIISKKDLLNPETQCLEDIICLVFLNYYFTEFAKKYDDDKLIHILKKTWQKMSEKGHKKALELELDENATKLIKAALSS